VADVLGRARPWADLGSEGSRAGAIPERVVNAFRRWGIPSTFPGEPGILRRGPSRTWRAQHRSLMAELPAYPATGDGGPADGRGGRAGRPDRTAAALMSTPGEGPGRAPTPGAIARAATEQ